MSKKYTKKNNKDDYEEETLDTVEETDNTLDEDNIDENNNLDEDEDYIEETEDTEETEVINECLLDKIIEEDTYDNYNIYNEIEETKDKDNILKGENRISANRLTKYEMVRILGERIKQLTMGAKPLIKNYESLNYDKIAEEELKLNMIPYKIKRTLPNGKYEIWALDELFKDHLMTLLE